MRYLTCDPNVEVIGASMLSIVENMRADEIRPLLEKHNLTTIEPDKWYPAQDWLSAMNEIAQHPDTTPNFVAIGMEVATNIILPPDLDSPTLPQMLEMWDALYHMQHRGGDIGYVKTEKLGEKHYRTTHVHLYPDDFTYGIAYGWCRRFLPPGTRFTVKYENINRRLDMGNGDETVILVEWK